MGLHKNKSIILMEVSLKGTVHQKLDCNLTVRKLNLYFCVTDYRI